MCVTVILESQGHWDWNHRLPKFISIFKKSFYTHLKAKIIYYTKYNNFNEIPSLEILKFQTLKWLRQSLQELC